MAPGETLKWFPSPAPLNLQFSCDVAQFRISLSPANPLRRAPSHKRPCRWRRRKKATAPWVFGAVLARKERVGRRPRLRPESRGQQQRPAIRRPLPTPPKTPGQSDHCNHLSYDLSAWPYRVGARSRARRGTCARVCAGENCAGTRGQGARLCAPYMGIPTHVENTACPDSVAN